MATDNPKLSVYLPPEVLEQLKKFKDDQQIKSLSAAAVSALEQFFGLDDPEEMGEAVRQRFEALEHRLELELEALQVRFDTLEQSLGEYAA